MPNEEKEKKRKKQFKRMGKILTSVWETVNADFHDLLLPVGRKLDEKAYKVGRHGWEDFAKDLAGIFNAQIQGKTKHAKQASTHIAFVLERLGQVNESLVPVARNHVPVQRKPKSAAAMDLSSREARGLESLANFVETNGGDRSAVQNFTCKVTRKSNGKFDTTFRDANGRRYRSMLEVGRFLRLVANAPPRRKGSQKVEGEKKKVRRNLERLRKSLNRAHKSLDDYEQMPQEEEEEEEAQTPLPIAASASAAARVPDMTDFPGFQDLTPEILAVWDFLCIFERTLSLTPISMDDFLAALSYVPPTGENVGDDVVAPPVYLAEVHLSLLKLLFADKSSDDFWWSILETETTEGIEIQESVYPVIKFDIEKTLSEEEDPLLTASWLAVLEKMKSPDRDTIKTTVKDALKVVSNKYVAAYLRKTLDVRKMSGNAVAFAAIKYLAKTVRSARPDIGQRSSAQGVVMAARAKAVEDALEQMKTLKGAVSVKDEDVISDVEMEEDSDDDSDAEEGDDPMIPESEKPSSALPPKPMPTLVDLLLPPSKPSEHSEYVDSFTWPQILGATAARIIHRKRRVLNEIDDNLRESQGLPRLKGAERRIREKNAIGRILTECCDADIEPSIAKLCSGTRYLDIPPVHRLAMLRLLMEAAYDTFRLHEVVTGNYNQRTSALKALDTEQRRAKKEAKEKVAQDEKAARERLAQNARDAFLEDKKREIRKISARTKEFSNDVIDSLTEEDIVDFDEDMKADFEALPSPESFPKFEVNIMVKRMHEEAAFDTENLTVVTMEELNRRNKTELEEMQGQFSGFGGEEALQDESLSRETIRSLERLQRDIEKANELPEIRASVVPQIQEAIEDGTIKALRTAMNIARKAKLYGDDEDGVWTIEIVRAAALELEKAKQNKRVFDAQKELVAKRNRCFIRTEPTGRDRFGNRFWLLRKHDDETEYSGCNHLWVETEYTPASKDNSEPKPPPGFLNLLTAKDRLTFGADDNEGDLVFEGREESVDAYRRFSRREYHSSGFSSGPVRNHWGCHATEPSWRSVIKLLDSKHPSEGLLKAQLKENLEESVGIDEKADGDEDNDDSMMLDSGDGAQLDAAKKACESQDVGTEAVSELQSAIGERVRIRQIMDVNKDPQVARYENGSIQGWKLKQGSHNGHDEVDTADGSEPKVSEDQPLWKAVSERGDIYWLNGIEVVQSIARFKSYEQKGGYFESDAAFLSYRNTLGKYCGKVAEAPYASSPAFLAKLMIKREGELYPKLKNRNHDNEWGGQSGKRALWINSMRDFAYDFQTVKQGLLTLETAFFQLTCEFQGYPEADDTPEDISALLSDPATAFDVELESMEKNLPGLWNSRTARAIFLHIIGTCSTTGFLALGLDLLYRNTFKYLQRHKLLNNRTTRKSAAAAI